MVCLPILRLEVVKLAWPLLIDTVSIVTDASLKVIDPVGLNRFFTEFATTVVKVTGWPNVDGLAELVVASRVPPGFRITATNADEGVRMFAAATSGAPSLLK